MSFPEQHRSNPHSTKPLERLNKEVKRRADVVGIFPNEDSINRLVGAVLLEHNDEWQLQHRHMQIEGMAALATPQTDEAKPLQIILHPRPPNRGGPGPHLNYAGLTDVTRTPPQPQSQRRNRHAFQQLPGHSPQIPKELRRKPEGGKLDQNIISLHGGDAGSVQGQSVGVSKRFDIKPQKRFSVGGPQIQAPVGKLHRQPVEPVSIQSEVTKRGLDTGNGRVGLCHSKVDLARGREGRAGTGHQFGKAQSAAAHQFGNQEPRDHAAVTGHEVAEIVMGRHLAALDGTGVAQRLLEERMPGARRLRAPACRCDDGSGVPDHTRVVDDGRPWLFREEDLCQKAHDIFPRHKLTIVVKEKAALKVAVPCHAQIGTCGHDRFGGHRLVFGQQRVWDTIRKAAIRRMMHADKLQGRAARDERLGDGVKGRPRRAIACIHQDRHRPQRRSVDERQDTFNIGRARHLR